MDSCFSTMAIEFPQTINMFKCFLTAKERPLCKKFILKVSKVLKFLALTSEEHCKGFDKFNSIFIFLTGLFFSANTNQLVGIEFVSWKELCICFLLIFLKRFFHNAVHSVHSCFLD